MTAVGRSAAEYGVAAEEVLTVKLASARDFWFRKVLDRAWEEIVHM